MSLKQNLDRAVSNYQLSDRHRWVTCLAASRVVGNYAEGETIKLAQALGVSIMHVGRLAKAGMAYRLFRRYNPKVRGRIASPKHFYTMFDLWQKFEFHPREAAEQLRTALEEGTSAETLSSFVRGEHEDTTQDWQRFMKDINAAKRNLDRATHRAVELTEENRDALSIALSVLEDLVMHLMR